MTRRRLVIAGMTALTALALAGPATGAFLQQAKLTVVRNGRIPTWNVTYLLCHVSPGRPVAEISEQTYRQGAKARTLDVWSWGKKTLAPPGSGRCAWYHSKTIRSKFPQRAGYVTAVTLEIFDPDGRRSPACSACTHRRPGEYTRVENVGFLDRLFGGTKSSAPGPWVAEPPGRSRPSEDEQAIERYRYLLRTASPETIEEAHADAFAHLTPEQRKLVLAGLSRELPEHERAAGYDDDPRSLARLATRTEMRQPGSLERSFGGMGGFGGTMASSFLGAFAGLLIGSAIAEQFFGEEGIADQSADGDFGGGDFGGGDFGGGDFGGF